ncbi:MAG: T9SS type A sorting domain-containing protein [Flavobacteriales bacterium]|nr:T9SS type A sorting domain-containing protein [Flavobacteriales bacterium]
MRILFPLAFLLCSTLNAQTIFAPNGASWTYTQRFASTLDSSLFRVECTGDTLLQGTSCSVLDFGGGISDCMGFRQYVTTVGDSVMFWEPIDSTFRTLYVFGLNPGEGWQTLVGRGYFDQGAWVTVFDTLSFVVTMSDTVEINGISLRWSAVEANWSALNSGQNVPLSGMITERSGHSLFMFPWIDGACDVEYNGPLRCYSDPDITWLNPQFPQCGLSVGLNEFPEGSSFWIRPTLATAGEPIEVNGSQGTVTVLDAVGHVVIRKNIQGRTSVDIDTPGTYIVRFAANEGAAVHQRIVVH